jgi:porphyrinogen peroxidase
MATAQTGIFALGTSSHAYLEFDLRAAAAAADLVVAVASLREPRTTIGGVNIVCGFRPELWAGVAPDAAVPGVTGFNTPIVGAGGFTHPATQHDVVIWLTGASYDVVFDLSHAVATALLPIADLAHELVGWPYHHDRDLTGFIDGTENPTLVEATRVAIIPDGETGEGGSLLLLQQWDHDVTGWESLPIEVQELAMGRRKADSQELDPKPPASHVGVTDQDVLGKIFRRNIGFGTLSQHGTIFVGFCSEQRILDRMLRAMAGLDGSPRDQLTNFTKPVTGGYYVIPSVERLAQLSGGFAAEA